MAVSPLKFAVRNEREAFLKWLIKANHKQKISRKWGEKPHFWLIFGRSDRVRTCGIDIPNAKNLIFCVILRAFRGFCVRIDCFRVLFTA